LEIAPGLATATALLLAACAAPQAKAPEQVFKHQQLHDPLLTIRGADRVCHSESEACKQWTVLMLNCEQGTADSCQEAEQLRQQASGVASATEPEAHTF
tara:strand:+ start:1465 stop:1761 length:297 start_codon:yes stop_codon:yes gene_type:complete